MIRTPDLRRAKSRYYYRACSPLFRTTCKIALLPLAAFVGVRCYSCGLVYYWCRRAVTSNPLGGGMRAGPVESSTEEVTPPRSLEALDIARAWPLHLVVEYGPSLEGLTWQRRRTDKGLALEGIREGAESLGTRGSSGKRRARLVGVAGGEPGPSEGQHGSARRAARP